MSDPIALSRRLDREQAAKAKRDEAKRKREEARALRGETGTKRKRRRRRTSTGTASACRYRVRASKVKKTKCFKKMKTAVSAAKGYVRKGKASASVSGPSGKSRKVKVIKVCRKPANGGKPRCESKVRRRRRRASDPMRGYRAGYIPGMP